MSDAGLGGVPETALWTLRNRAEEALRADAVLVDDEAVRLYRSLGTSAGDLSRFGALSQTHPLRALAFDTAVRDFLTRHPGRPVVALGEGLQTSYWRLGRPEVAWFSIDVADMVAVQERVLPPEPAITRLGMSALAREWQEMVPPGPAMITAEGLFMYLPREQVHALIADLAQRFPGGRLIYDSIPRWFSRKTMSGSVQLTDGYTAPPMPHSQTVSQAARLPRQIAGVATATDVLVPPGRGQWASPALRTLARLPVVRDLRPSITLLTFAD